MRCRPFLRVVAVPLVLSSLPHLAHALQWQQDAQVTGMATCMAEGPDSAVWVGTGDGCVRKLGAAAPLVQRQGHVVTALHVDADGTLWIGWEDGLSREVPGDPTKSKLWDKAVTKPVPVLGAYMLGEGDLVPFGEVECLARTSKGLLASSTTNGLLSLVAEFMWDARWPHFWGPNTEWITFADVFPSKRVHAVLEDANGDVWFASADGILQIDRASMIFGQRRSGYYSGTYGDKAFGKPSVRFTAASHGLPSDDATCVASQVGRRTWSGFAKGGVALRDGEGKWNVTHAGENGLPPGRVTALTADGDGRVWAAVEMPEPPDGVRPALPQPLRDTVPGRRWTNYHLAWTRGEPWQLEACPVPRWTDWPTIHALLCSASGRLYACTSEGLWSTSAAPPLRLERAALRRPAPIADAAQPVELPPARPVATTIPEDPAAIMQAVVERNRPWLLPPTEALKSLEYRFTLEHEGVQEHFRWEAPSYSSLDVTWDRDGLVPDLLPRRWLSFDEGVSEAMGGQPALPLDAERLDADAYQQDCLTGGELQTALRIYARHPEAFTLGLVDSTALVRPPLIVELKPDRGKLGQIPELAARLHMVSWAYGVSPSHLWRALVFIDRERLAPTSEQWYWEDDAKPTHEVQYRDSRETPDGHAVPVAVDVRWFGRSGRDEPKEVFRSGYAWYEPGVWLLAEAEQTGEEGGAKATVSGVRTNADLGLARELAAAGDDLMERRTRAIEILNQVAERNSPWLSAELDPAFLEATYRFELRQLDGRVRDIRQVSLSAENAPRWSRFTLGTTLGIPLASLVAEPEKYAPVLAGEREQGGRRVYVIRAGSPDWVGIGPCGNGLSGTWCGYFTWAWRQLECVLDAETLLPVSADVGEDEQRYADYQEVAPGKFAPMTITVPGWFEYHFVWAGDCLWIAKETRSQPDAAGKRAVGRITNLVVNGESVAAVPALTPDEIAAAEAERKRVEDEEL